MGKNLIYKAIFIDPVANQTVIMLFKINTGEKNLEMYIL